jgi:thiol-disulfide isomerase/thioredoxin
MNKQYFILMYVTLIVTGCKVYINEDGSRMLSEQDKRHIVTFGKRNVDVPITTPDSITLEAINVQELKLLCSNHKISYVHIWASTCRSCLEKMDSVITSVQKEGLHLVLIAEDYHIKKIQEILFKHQYFDTAYVINANEYGYKSSAKLKQFLFELTTNAEYLDGYPQQYLINQAGEVIKYAGGNTPYTEFLKKD